MKRADLLAGAALVATLCACLWPLTLHLVAPIWDADEQFANYYTLVADHARQWKIATWNPWSDGGMPIFLEPQAGALSPLTSLAGIVLGSTEAGYSRYWLLLWCIAALGMYALVRGLGAPRWAGFALGLAYALSGPFTGNAEHISWVYANAFLPWIVWRWDVALRAGRWDAAAQAGALLGLAALAGYPGHIVGTCVFLLLWTIARGRDVPWRRLPLLAGVAGTVALVVLAPLYASFFLEARGFSDRTGALPRVRALVENALYPDALWTLASPALAPLGVARAKLFGPTTDVSSVSLYLGLPALVLVAWALTLQQGRRWRWALIGIAFVAFVLACSATFPLRGWLYDALPPFRYFRHSSLFRVYVVLALLCVAATATTQSPTRRGAIAAVAVGFAALLITYVWVPATPALLHVALVCALAALAFLAASSRPQAFAGVMLAAVVADSATNVQLSAPTMWNWDRTHWDALNARHEESLQVRDFTRVPFTGLGNYNLVTKRAELFNYSALGSSLHAKLVDSPTLIEMVSGTRRVWFTRHAAIVEANAPTMDAFLKSVAGRPAFVLHAPGGMRKPTEAASAIPPLEPATPVNVTLETYTPTQLVFTTMMDAPGWLFIGDRWAAGWRATVNGKKVPLYGANFVFRAVEVQAGPVRVEFSYRPKGLSALLALSWLALLLSLSLPLWRKGHGREYHGPSRARSSED